MITDHLPNPNAHPPGTPGSPPAGTQPEQRNPPKRTAKQLGPNVAYSVRAFVDDHRRLLAETHPHVSECSATIQLIDGRMHVVRPDLTLKVSVATQRELFVTKYGRGPETAYRSRFLLVLKFIETWQAEIRQSGLADGAGPVAVREEFVDFLLKYQLDALQEAIPRSALRWFLDEWGHRRM
jgi:hypothetical protein